MAKVAARNKLVVHPEEAEIVRLIYELYLTNFGAKSIAERLNKQGQLYRGKPWSKNRILDIIGDESYIGRYYFNKKEAKTHKLKPREEWIEIPVPPIIDPAAWEKARELKKQRYPQEAHTNPAVEVSKTLLTGLTVCGLCGRSMTLECGKGGRYTYYNCSGYLRSGKSTCRGQRIPAPGLEEAVLYHLTEKLFTKERVKEILKRIYDDLKTLGARNDNLRNSLQKQLEGTQARLKRQFEAIESGVVGLQEVGERIRELKSQREQLEVRLDELKRQTVIPLHYFTDEALEAFQDTIKELFLGGDDRATVKRHLQLFIKRIVITLPKVEIFGKPDVVLAVLQNKKAVRTGGVLTAVDSWLPEQDLNLQPSG